MKPMERAKLIGRRIAELRKKQKKSQRAFAKYTNGIVTASQLANYELGIREPSYDTLAQLANLLRVNPGFLCGFSAFQVKLSKEEVDLVEAFRTLPQRDREQYMARIQALSLAYRTPVPDEKLGGFAAARETAEEPPK